jgi:hypothetical protein
LGSRATRPDETVLLVPVADFRRTDLARTALLLAGLLALTVSVALPRPAPLAAAALSLLIAAVLAHRSLTGWHTLLALILVVILFIPIRRYTMPGNLPFQLEPYRLLVGVIGAGWLTSMLVDSRVRLRGSGFEGPMLLYAAAALLSVILNTGRIQALGVQTDVVKKLTFFASFMLLFYFVVSVVRTAEMLDKLVKLLVGGAVAVSLSGIFEARTGYNFFNHLGQWIPVLRLSELPDVPGRGARLRIYASAQHPIALGAMLVMMIPLAIYLYRRFGHKRWIFAAGILALGALATVSRTSIIMLFVVFLVFLWLRPVETKRILPALLPLVVAANLAIPGTLGSLREAFFPKGGLVAEQAADPGRRGSGRVADLPAAMAKVKRQPLVGQGMGTMITDQDRQNADILDDQWLGTLLETGLLGALSLVWLFRRAVSRLAKAAKADDTPRGWLFAGIAASVTAYSVGMITYDAFSFIQVTIIMYILLGFAACALAMARERPPS